MKIPSLLLALSSLFVVSACGGSNAAVSPASTGGGKKVDSGTAGSITGRVTYKGTPPEPTTIRMGSDPACVQGAGPNPQNDALLVGADGAIENVFVYVKDGLDPAYSFDVPTAAVQLDQRGCRYTPRVLGVRVNQPIELVNSDPTLHNVHAMPITNKEFNASAPVPGWRRTQTFTAPEVMVRFKCDVHGWMAAWVGVMTHPYFAVTKADGAFNLAGLPPGTYTVEAWHEKLGTRTQQVTIGDRQTQNVTFSFE